jgi:hypothetical protein
MKVLLPNQLKKFDDAVLSSIPIANQSIEWNNIDTRITEKKGQA